MKATVIEINRTSQLIVIKLDDGVTIHSPLPREWMVRSPDGILGLKKAENIQCLDWIVQ